MTQNTPTFDSYRLKSTVATLKSVTSRSRIFVRQSNSKDSRSRIYKNGNLNNVSSRSLINSSQSSNVGSRSAINGDNVPLLKASRSAILKTSLSNKSSRSSIKPVTPISHTGSNGTIKALITSNKQSRSNVFSLWLDSYKLKYAASLRTNKSIGFDIRNTLTKTVSSNFFIDGPRIIDSRSAIKKTTTSHYASRSSVKKTILNDKTSKSFVFNSDVVPWIDSYKLKFSLNVRSAKTSLSSVSLAVASHKASRNSVKKTFVSEKTSRSFVHHSIRSHFKIDAPGPHGRIKYNQFYAKYNGSFAKYNRSWQVFVSNFTIRKTVLNDKLSRSSILVKALSNKTSRASVLKKTNVNVGSQFHVEQLFNARKDQPTAPLFKFNLMPRSANISYFTFAVEKRKTKAGFRDDPDRRMKPLYRVFQFDVGSRSNVTVFKYGIHPNKVFKKKKERTPPFSFDLAFRGKEE